MSKLIIMQGGLESRFIPELSDKTKLMIEGFFKITQDDQLRDLALKPAESVEKSESDVIVERIVEHSDKYANESIDNVDYVNVTLEVLQNEVATKKGPLMRIGGPDGMRLTRAAFLPKLAFPQFVCLCRNPQVLRASPIVPNDLG